MGRRGGGGQTERVCSWLRRIQCDQRSVNTEPLLSGSAEYTSDTLLMRCVKKHRSVDPTLPNGGDLILDYELKEFHETI